MMTYAFRSLKAVPCLYLGGPASSDTLMNVGQPVVAAIEVLFNARSNLVPEHGSKVALSSG